MKKSFLLSTFALLLFSVAPCLAQEKGVDVQNTNIRESGNDRAPGRNGVNQTVGTGSGIDFGRGRTEVRTQLPNPFRLTGRRDALLKSVEEVMQEHQLIVDSSASRTAQGIVISQPLTFTKGAVVSESELSRYANLPRADTRGWTRGRVTYIVELQPVDLLTANVAVNVKIEGRTDGITGAEWITLESNGSAEQEFLIGLVQKVNGTLP